MRTKTLTVLFESHIFNLTGQAMLNQKPIVFAIAVVLAVIIPLSIVNSAETQPNATLEVKVYKVAKLVPLKLGARIWDPSPLIKTLEEKLGKDALVTFAPYQQTLSLIITTTPQNHEIIAKTIEHELKRQEKADKEKGILIRVYPVRHLATYTKNKNIWKPGILIELLKAKTGDDASAAFAANEEDQSIVVSATPEKHDIIAKTLERF
ncbi:MAG: hypothetical protein KDB00_29655 [Planctomycetales bacterium]|nr:hypothetical protein [Planctomycetales bacterium]